MIDDKTFLFYDIETYKNFFCVVFKYQDRYNVFEISSRKDQTEELRQFMYRGYKTGWYFVGFNNVRFDAQVMQWLYDGKVEGVNGEEKARSIYGFAQDVIARTSEKQFPPYPEYEIANKQIDLFLQNHYNNMARSTSLKWLEYSMNWKKVQDLPHRHDEDNDVSVFDEIIEYCKNDVDATQEFFGKSRELVELRFSQDESEPELNLMNKSDSSVGEALFLDMMSRNLGIKKSVLKKRQTHHSKIKLKDVILPYINFRTEEFNGVLEYFRQAEITTTNKAFKHSVWYKGIEYVYGTGGIHASWDNRIFEETETTMLLDLDISSFYPNLAIRNGFYPKHLSKEFCVLYEEIYETRKKIPKSNPQNKSLKLLLNSVYGKSGDIYSFLYDRFFQMCITVNGQLILTMLAERLSFIEGVTVIQCNTDGVTIELPKDKKRDVYAVWKWFEEFSKLELEHAVYKKMAIRDVNNYLAVYDDGKVKMKGAFEIDVEFHKNRSQRIVPIAVKRYLVHGVPVEETITQHLVHGKDYGDIENQGVFDFCLGKKIKWNQNYTLEEPVERELPRHAEEEKKQLLLDNGWELLEDGENWRNKKYHKTDKASATFSFAYNRLMNDLYPDFKVIRNIDDKVIRFFVSKNGQYLSKNYSDGRREVTVGGNKVTLFMDHYESDDYNIDYGYYIDEAYKIIHEVDGTNERKARESEIERERLKEEKRKEKEQQQKQRQEEMYIRYCVEKSPTEKQFERYGLDWLVEKYGRPKEIRPST